jgi:rare lipoprotein A
VRVVVVVRITYAMTRAATWGRDGEPATQLAAVSDSPTPERATLADPPGDAPLVPPPVSASTPPTARASTEDAKGFWVQLGVFRQAAAAVELQQRVERELESLRPLMAIFSDKGVNRLQAGPYRSRAEARSAAAQLRSVLQLAPVIVERR